MKKLVPILVVLAILAVVGWPIGVVYVENYEFSSDMRDLAVQNKARIGLESVNTEDELRIAVMASAQQHGISLAPDHLTVHRTLTAGTFTASGTPEIPSMLEISIAAAYDAPVDLPGLTFHIHFSPASSHSAPMILK